MTVQGGLGSCARSAGCRAYTMKDKLAGHMANPVDSAGSARPPQDASLADPVVGAD